MIYAIAIVVALIGAIVFMTMTLAMIWNDKRHNVIREELGVTLSYDSIDHIFYVYTETSVWIGREDQQEAEVLFDVAIQVAQAEKLCWNCGAVITEVGQNCCEYLQEYKI